MEVHTKESQLTENDQEYPKVLGLSRCSKANGHNTEAWSAHRKYKGTSMRKYYTDARNGGTEKAYKKAVSFLTRLNKVIYELKSSNK